MKALALLAAFLAGPAAATEWLKAYTLAPYKQIWSTRIAVRSLQNDLPKIVRALEKNGGSATQPMAVFARDAQTQQMSFSISKSGAGKALKAIGKIGKADEPRVNLPPEVVPIEEVRAKRGALEAEQKSNAAALAGMPAINDAVAELLARLRQVEAVQARTDAEVLWNISVEEKR